MSTRPNGIKRRSVLIASSVAVAGGSTLLLLDDVFSNNSPLADSYAARTIGARFAGTYPKPDELWRGGMPESAEQWAPRLRELIREDFDTNRLVQVDGWWLAQTELLLCVYIYVHSV